MQKSATLVLFAGLTVADPAITKRDGPSGHEVEIIGFTYGGNGCPSGSVGSMLSTDLTTLTLIYDSFIAESGPGIKANEYRKTCQANFSVLKADYRGRATLPKDISSNKDFKGPVDEDYLKTDGFGVEGLLNVKSAIQISPLDSNKKALLTSESTDLTFKQVHYLQWRKCTKKA
ncbi:hypothetical protein B0I37DRAFT_358288 [Chaetomium sp. MPI-CAGE-AT-0009]|nr:hypothetical protein B0I37DRAFT_358288 [Chaetomium sp. MPI-CAGE-AT-0009]